MDFELLQWGDGTIRLTFWDNLHGEDLSFVLKDDGTMVLVQDDEAGKESYIPQTMEMFVGKLRELVKARQ